jgi:hypothetical protein
MQKLLYFPGNSLGQEQQISSYAPQLLAHSRYAKYVKFSWMLTSKTSRAFLFWCCEVLLPDYYTYYECFQIISPMLLVPRRPLNKQEWSFGMEGWSGVREEWTLLMWIWRIKYA